LITETWKKRLNEKFDREAIELLWGDLFQGFEHITEKEKLRFETAIDQTVEAIEEIRKELTEDEEK
jgi:hypothetical protein